MKSPVVSVLADLPAKLAPWRERLADHYLIDEASQVESLLAALNSDAATESQIKQLACSLVRGVRDKVSDQSALDAFMQQYDLSSEEGVLLMCLAEALLRVPDGDTADKLIADKLGEADWEAHLGKSPSLFVNASTWGLMLTGRLVRVADSTRGNFIGTLTKLVAKTGEPVVRQAVRQAMKIMGHQFVMGRSIAEAMKRARHRDNRDYRYSFDMLGEAALTAADAERYYQAYVHAIEAIGASGPFEDVLAAPSISVKLSALHPRYRASQYARVIEALTPRLLNLARAAQAQGIALTIDAEEAERLQLSLDLFAAVYGDSELAGWEGLGIVVQAYQKRALAVVDFLTEEARRGGRRIPVRLVKGAYWDSEIKLCQEQGLAGYPVFTRKAHTDLSYLVCAQRLLAAGDCFYPQFATHNAHTLAAVYRYAGDNRAFEYQRLHGMGEELYEQVIGADQLAVPCRVYAPVGNHKDLLPYLVRRLLENGANTSFVNRITNQQLPVEEIVGDPIGQARRHNGQGHPNIPLPRNLYGSVRINSAGINLADEKSHMALAADIAAHPPGQWQAAPLVPGAKPAEQTTEVYSPTDCRHRIGHWQASDSATVDLALQQAHAAHSAWDLTPVAERSACLERAADLLVQERGLLMSLLIHEAGKTLPDAVSEIREAVDFCRYYATQAKALFEPVTLPGPTGERNVLSQHGRGLFVAISPWNFPLAIFLGQISAALVCGNTVLAKPAPQTNLVAYQAVRILHQAGIPPRVLQLLPGDGVEVGARLTQDERVAGVVFTGSTATAQSIHRSLAARSGPLATLVAETGGINCMIADSSALAEQLVQDVIASAFQSAGQRCSALRVLFLQQDVADRSLAMLAGAMDQLVVGDPALLSTDVGPVIDQAAYDRLQAHHQQMTQSAHLIAQTALPPEAEHGLFVAPAAFEINSLEELQQEVFGPILHVVRYRARDLNQVIDQINQVGYGLTLGVHSRVDATWQQVTRRARCGNRYVNRNMIGAVVGVQPFGGEGLSGTGPKAGGPHYLQRFVTERTLTVNTAAVGGNASLLVLDEQ